MAPPPFTDPPPPPPRPLSALPGSCRSLLQAHPKMAEIPLYFVDLQDDSAPGWVERVVPSPSRLREDSGACHFGDGFEDYGPDCNNMKVTAFLDIPGQDNLPLLTRLEKYAFIENTFNRQIIARGLLDIFQGFSNNEEDFLTVMEIVVRLSEDAEPTVRTELMEQIPPIAIFLQENRSNFPVVLSEYLLPIVVRNLTDPNNQVRKSSQEVLLILLEQDLVFQHDIENTVCPILLQLCALDSDDEYKAEAVSVCAANFGDSCHAVGQEATEKFLIPKFFELCSDSVWGMRKACAECFTAVSRSSSPEVRRTRLSLLFIRLVSDPCRWVHQAAFQSLGPFICTFANPSRAGLYLREDDALSIWPLTQDVNSAFASGSPTPSSGGNTFSASHPGSDSWACPGLRARTSSCF
uniref:putative serine/threonine-protein phosphatase 4 regulatory subunit 1-like isoform X2 n=1 Tax=Callithrix jacchus TaxID=9483 RepID=UPI0023DD4F38|nr:putative serine/threonine-protein phosphatase 4 regulatory subunit 1-like isoform X2 [Callithrix jacchus]